MSLILQYTNQQFWLIIKEQYLVNHILGIKFNSSILLVTLKFHFTYLIVDGKSGYLESHWYDINRAVYQIWLKLFFEIREFHIFVSEN